MDLQSSKNVGYKVLHERVYPTMSNSSYVANTLTQEYMQEGAIHDTKWRGIEPQKKENVRTWGKEAIKAKDEEWEK